MPMFGENVWSEIRGAGFGERVKNRDLRRLWTRRHDIRKKVELLELGRAWGGSQEGHEDCWEDEEGVRWRGDEECSGFRACTEKEEGGR